MGWLQIEDYGYPGGWKTPDPAKRASEYCEKLESGSILYFPTIPFDFPDADREFLLSQKQSGFRHHKNVSYRPKTDLLRGASNDDPEDTNACRP